MVGFPLGIWLLGMVFYYTALKMEDFFAHMERIDGYSSHRPRSQPPLHCIETKGPLVLFFFAKEYIMIAIHR